MTREESIVENIYNLAYTKLATEKSGHDFWHTYRVYKSATKIAKDEGAVVFICQVSALVHDLIDDKLDESIRLSLEKLEKILGDFGLTHSEVERVVDIITKMSFKGGTNKEELSLEGQVVQDADRLDAIGAIGIARTICYSGYKGRPIHNPHLEVRENMTFEQYRNEDSSAINHFYEKLLKLKSLMNTSSAKKLAEGRHKFMEEYLERFYKEWQGEI